MSEAISPADDTSSMEEPRASVPSSEPGQLEFTPQQLLSNLDVEEPLIANGVRCHGGFDASGRYHSPRTLHRTPAIEAWQAKLLGEGHSLVAIDPALMPPQYPSDAQSVLLLANGVRDPIVRAVTTVSIVEGFGAIIRDVRVPDLESMIVEPIEGTALAHLTKGLFEAHARDEAGYRDEGGHKQMWEAARDLAFENPKIPGDVLMRIMGRRRSGGPKAERPFPQLDETFERMVRMMSQVFVVEIFAERVFEWGKSVMGNPKVSADPNGAAEMVAYIQSDEKPHVEYLRAALSEISARTIRTVDGGTIPGKWVVHGFMHTILSQMTRNRPRDQREDTDGSLDEILSGLPNAASVREEFDGLKEEWTPPSRTGFELGLDGNVLSDAEVAAGSAA